MKMIIHYKEFKKGFIQVYQELIPLSDPTRSYKYSELMPGLKGWEGTIWEEIKSFNNPINISTIFEEYDGLMYFERRGKVTDFFGTGPLKLLGEII